MRIWWLIYITNPYCNKDAPAGIVLFNTSEFSYISHSKSSCMKKLLLCTLVCFAFSTAHTFAQTAPNTVEEPNCYLKWIKKFEERGADDVADGSYTDVIITFRVGNGAECFNGKVDVKANIVTAFYIKREDGSYEQVKKKMKHTGPVEIIGGVSQTMLTSEDELINVMFVKKIRPRKAGFQKAVAPTDD
jgi:hypothetical protein